MATNKFSKWLDISQKRALATQRNLEKERLLLVEKELSECSFSPQPFVKKKTTTFGSTSGADSTSYSTIFDLHQKRSRRKELQMQQAVQDRKQKELDECTFQPNISPNTERILKEKEKRIRSEQQQQRYQRLDSRNTSTSSSSRTSTSRSRKKKADNLNSNGATATAVTLKQLSSVFQCAWEGVLSHQHGYFRTDHLQKHINADPFRSLQEHICASLDEINFTRCNESDDNNIRLESKRRSSVHQYLALAYQTAQTPRDLMHSNSRHSRQTSMMHSDNHLQQQKLKIRALQQKREEVFRRLIKYYRERMDKERLFDNT